MKKTIILYFFLFLGIFIVTGCHKKETENKVDISKNALEDKLDIDEDNLYSGRNGTADTIDGKTVIISIYANEEKFKWDFDSEEDMSTLNDTFNNLKIATEYLTNQVDKYNKKAEFIYDWHKFSDLRYEATFKDNIVDYYDSLYGIQKDWIIDNIDITKIKKKYEADNIIFVYFFNTDNTSSAITSTYNLDIDIVNVFPENDRYVIPPATYAHELLHTFGAPDLYFANAIINQEYVDYYMEINSSDIMASVYYGDEITNTFSDLDAYYVGLIDSHPDIEKWNLGISEHITN